MPVLLVVEDEVALAHNIARYLGARGWDVHVAVTAEDALSRFASVAPDVVLMDFDLPSMDGLAALTLMRDRDPGLRVVMGTGRSTVQLAVESMKAGATDFVSKPYVLAELAELLGRTAAERRHRRLREHHHGRLASSADELLGESLEIRMSRARLRQVAGLDPAGGLSPPPVLIQGETGTGKQLAARAIHFESRRRDAPFIDINCAAIPLQLLEAELFGYEPGAFTDARVRKIGLIEAADQGTLFLDEIGEMPLETQAKLLKVLDGYRVRRLGSLNERSVNVRIIAATNQPLERLVATKRFRLDLLHRIGVLQINLPPLRKRPGDVVHLARLFMKEAGLRYSRPEAILSPEAEQALTMHDWPGNVRELKNTIEQAFIGSESEVIGSGDISLAPAERAIEPVADRIGAIPLEEAERELIVRALERADWNVVQAAKDLRISRDTLRYRMKRHRIRRSGEVTSGDEGDGAG